ncbi:hypothetical protein V6R21_15540 [Limibacter armeniacum]|uniref:hypothetical protein n=1 Tax=Limibacter armeniacum TaxID=466084 RepID=UPI002FE504E9
MTANQNEFQSAPYIDSNDDIFISAEGGAPNYNVKNPVWKLAGLVQKVDMAAEREFYLGDSLDYLFPFRHLVLYNEAGKEAGPVVEPRDQDNKNDFQKQNIKDFIIEHFYLVRGYATVEGKAYPFLKVSYDAGTGTPLSEATGHNLGKYLHVWLKVRDNQVADLIKLPYNEANDRYEVELWGFTDGDLYSKLDTKGQKAMEREGIIIRTDLIKGSAFDFTRERVESMKKTYVMSKEHTMHPILPLPVELAFTDVNERHWDSLDGRNYRVVFNMLFRGWNNYIQGGVSANPHGGVGHLEFRNLFSNYFTHTNHLGNELKKDVYSWNFDAHGNRSEEYFTEKFMAVEYMDLHILKSNCVIGIHRHRDNQEIFMMMKGSAMMVTGDWIKFPDRMRAFEVKNMREGDLVLCKNGMLHSLVNLTDEDIQLFMFGGYD